MVKSGELAWASRKGRMAWLSGGSSPVRRSADELMNSPLRPVYRWVRTTGYSMVWASGARAPLPP
jgi:hypothetical protein